MVLRDRDIRSGLAVEAESGCDTSSAAFAFNRILINKAHKTILLYQTDAPCGLEAAI